MPKASKYSPASKSALKFQWAAFCQKILTAEETKEKSLIGLTNDISANVEVGGSVPEGKFTIPVGAFWVFAVFSRIDGKTTAISEKVELRITTPTHEQRGVLDLKLEAGHRFGQIQVNLQTLHAALEYPKEDYHGLAKVQFYIGNNEVGVAEMPIHLAISYRETKK